MLLLWPFLEDILPKKKLKQIKMPEIIKTEDLIPGKIYFIKFSENTQLIGRFKEHDTCHLQFFDLLHYWNSFENFWYGKENIYCVKSGIEELRPATIPEKHALIKFELENDCI